MNNEIAANSNEIIWRRIESNVALSIVPSNPAKKPFKPKSILKPKNKNKSTKPDRNKENKLANAQNEIQPKGLKKQKSGIPRPNSQNNVFRNLETHTENTKSDVFNAGSRK